tara:strand:- start:25 stop:468 length:444 start_codon:yes stop_codon:yes gene_type:complete
MPSYPAKPYVVPQDEWFNDNSINFKNKSTSKGTKKISTIHEFFYEQSDLKVGGSDNFIETKSGNKLSTKIVISSLQNSNDNFLYKGKEKFKHSKIPSEIRLTKKGTLARNSFSRDLSNKNIFNLRSYLLDLKSFFIKIITRKKKIKN